MASDDEDEGLGPIAATGKASEDKLGDLHGVVSEYLTLAIQSGKASPALIGAAITFLKNNSITADPSTNAAIRGLTESLQARRRKGGGLTPTAAREAEEHFGNLIGGIGLQ